MQNSKKPKPAQLVNFELQKTQRQRLKNVQLSRALFGLVAFFEDQQIRDRQGAYSSLYHSSQADISAKSKITIWPWLNKKDGISLPMFLKVKNKEGEWANQMHALPELLGSRGKTAITVQDSNMFITGFCALPLCQLNERKLPKSKRVVENLLELSFDCVQDFKRGKAYNFWPQQDPVYGKTVRTGPYNIWAGITNSMAKLLTNPKTTALNQKLKSKAKLPAFEWLALCLNPKINANGADSIFNIANDADDSSMALAFEYLLKNKKYVTKEMDTVIKEITQYRDIDRKLSFSDEFEHWKGENSGAYLTWLRDETDNSFTKAEIGLIPTGKNNVDVVVNANILFTLSLLGRTDSDGYQSCVNLLCKAIEEKTWPSAGLYYPQQMMFPYVLSRAIRDGGVKDKKLLQSQKKLMIDVLNLAKKQSKSFGIQAETLFMFEGGKDKSKHLSTALGLITLLNLGEEVAKNINQLENFQSTIEGCVSFLLKEVSYKHCLFESTQVSFSAYKRAKFVAHWEDGLFFGPVHWDLCHWRSQAVTNACVFEAFSKYLLAYEKNPAATLLEHNKLSVVSYELDKQKQGTWLKII
jgi:hypothetical protein